MMSEQRYCCEKFGKDRADGLVNLSCNKNKDEWFYYYKLTDGEALYLANIEYCHYCGVKIKPIQQDIDKLKQRLNEAGV